MTRRLPLAFAALLALNASALRGGDPRQARLRWDELGPRIDGRSVSLALPGGILIKGKLETTLPEGLRLRVTGTSDRKLVPKGSRLIPRENVSVLRVTEHRILARPLLALGAAGAIAASIASMGDTDEGVTVILRPAGAAAGGALGALAGYYAGKALDRKVTEILVIREDQR